MLGFIGGLLGIGYNVAKDAYIQNQPYYGTKRDMYRNNPRVQMERKGFARMMEDLDNKVPVEERNRRRVLGYYDGKDVQI